MIQNFKILLQLTLKYFLNFAQSRLRKSIQIFVFQTAIRSYGIFLNTRILTQETDSSIWQENSRNKGRNCTCISKPVLSFCYSHCLNMKGGKFICFCGKEFELGQSLKRHYENCIKAHEKELENEEGKIYFYYLFY